jgi:tetratricopeptide (TPR) repeat protein
MSELGQNETVFGEIVQRSICEMIDIEPVTINEAKERGGDLIALGLHAHPAGTGLTGLRVAVYQGLAGAPLWSASVATKFPMTGEPLGPELLKLSHRTSTALTDLLCRPTPALSTENDPNYYAGAGLRQMYSMQPGSVERAREMFDLAYDLRPRGLYLALRAQLAVIEYVESGGGNRQELSEAADEFCSKAMAEESTNSMVLSAVAHSRMVFDDDLTAASELSKIGVLANPSNPMAWSALANVLLNTERFEEAAQAAKTAIGLSKDTFFRYWTEFQFATTAVTLNRNDLALLHAERARSLNAKYRPALRYLIGLHLDKNSFDEARTAIARLQRLEPDTTAKRLVEDEEYPVRMMRRSGLVDRSRFEDL